VTGIAIIKKTNKEISAYNLSFSVRINGFFGSFAGVIIGNTTV
jgi:hypothetical protein